LLRLCVTDDLSMYLSSASADTSARRVGQVLFEDLLEQDEALAIFVELHLELPQLRELRSSIFLRKRVEPSVVPRRPGVFLRRGGSSTRNSIPCLVGGFCRSVEVIAFPRRVITVCLGVGVRLGSVETFTSFLQPSLPEGGDRVSSGA
jgi:hypothetical protein